MFPNRLFPTRMFTRHFFPRKLRLIVPGDGIHIRWVLGKIARVVRVAHNSRQYLAYRVLSGVVDVSAATVEVSIVPVFSWGNSPEPVFTTAEWGEDENGSPTVQVLIGPDTAYPLEVGLYKINWRITSGTESTIVTGDRYLEIYP